MATPVDPRLRERLLGLVEAAYRDQLALRSGELRALEGRAVSLRPVFSLGIDGGAVLACLLLLVDPRFAALAAIGAVLALRARRQLDAGVQALRFRTESEARLLRQRWVETLPAAVNDTEEYNQLLRLANLGAHVASAEYERERASAAERPGLREWALLWRVRLPQPE